MPYETLVGGSCFSAPTALELKTRINKNSPRPAVKRIRGQWVYYVDLKRADAASLALVKELLHDVDTLPLLASESGVHAVGTFVTPRYLSPWSSQATNIAHVCGLADVMRRVERGRLVVVEFEDALSSSSSSSSSSSGLGDEDITAGFRHVLHDRMTETFSLERPSLNAMFSPGAPAPLVVVDIFAGGSDSLDILREYNLQRGLSLDDSEMRYLVDVFTKLGRPPHDVELFMFAQVNSEHCRHKVFNASWTIDGVARDKSLFEMIRNTHIKTPDYTVSAYSDNAAVLQGEMANLWAPDYSTGTWKLIPEVAHILAKVETHNHPTAISPFPGAATGSGGEIRDEAAVGRGSVTKAGLCGFWVSDLLIPDHRAPWELDIGRPAHYASSLDIMLEAPIGSARFNNEFGRPCLTGCFRTLLTPDSSDDGSVDGVREWRGYHKPIMLAGGMGTVRPQNALKEANLVREGAHVIVLGGPAMLIGLGGGAASSNASGQGNAELDFDSVQRGNPEMERRAQMVINACATLGDQNPIAMIHDVGAGGLSNALPELVKDAGYGGNFELRQIESADSSMSPLQIWCNEAQERYVLLVNPDGMNRFTSICRRERCGFSDVGSVASNDAGGAARLVLTDRESKEYPRPIDLPMDALFPPKRQQNRTATSQKPKPAPFDALASLEAAYGTGLEASELLKKAVERVFMVPAVGSKSFLITIGDRTVGGLTTRDQMVGPWQTPVADVAVTATGFSLGSGGKQRTGEAMAVGEKPTLALIDAAASARMAVAESLLNLGAADLMGGDLRRVKLSANWMAAVNHAGEGAALYEAVRAIGVEMCPELGISIPVGKDSTSMKAAWTDGNDGGRRSVTAPVTAAISAFGLVDDVRRTWTPQLRRVEDVGETVLMFVDLAGGRQALGGSALAQSLGSVGGDEVPDVSDFGLLADYFDALGQLHKSGVVLAYHDRSDGGLLTTVAEMMFAGRCGVDLMLDGVARSGATGDILQALFNEELGAVFQVRAGDETNFMRCFATCGPPAGLVRKVAVVKPAAVVTVPGEQQQQQQRQRRRRRRRQTLTIRYGATTFAELGRAEMQRWWSRTSYEMQRLRDDAECAREEWFTTVGSPPNSNNNNNNTDEAPDSNEQDDNSSDNDPGLTYHLTFPPSERLAPLSRFFGRTPRVAVLREQGVNGHAELAFAFGAAGFEPVDVHMTDILEGRSLGDFTGLAAPGGFSYGDVLGAGVGWAKSVLLHAGARREMAAFFARPDTFALGVCNGCQVLTRLRELIPGAEHWPVFEGNRSRQFEARFTMVRVGDAKGDGYDDAGNATSDAEQGKTSKSATSSSAAAASVFFHGMAGSALPVVVSHGEGRATFSSPNSLAALEAAGMIPLRYVEPAPSSPTSSSLSSSSSSSSSAAAAAAAAAPSSPRNHHTWIPATHYPSNPNGSEGAVAAVAAGGKEGRFVAMMPHPERSVLADAASWVPQGDGGVDGWGDFGPWLRIFRSARRWVG